VLLITLLMSCMCNEEPKIETKGPIEADPPALVALVVLDTVRADHLSLCGYERDTSPAMKALVADRGYVYSCQGVTPGTWTVPSHASYLTGLRVPEHKADRKGGSLKDSYQTITEDYRARGYQTAMISANPTLADWTGLGQGFDTRHVAHKLTDWRGDALPREVADIVGSLDPAKPVFLLINLIDAHDPYPAVPSEASWGPVHSDLRLRVQRENGPFQRFVLNKMDSKQHDRFLNQLIKRYDWGIHDADSSLQRVLDFLHASPWGQESLRVAITSDHGEFLGEHGLLRHGCHVYEPVTRAPLMLFDSRKTPTIESGPIALERVYSFLGHGTLGPPAQAMSFAALNHDTVRPCKDATAAWGERKEFWFDESYYETDLVVDPREKALRKHQPSADFEKWTVQYKEHLIQANQETIPDDVAEQLRQLGYLDH